MLRGKTAQLIFLKIYTSALWKVMASLKINMADGIANLGVMETYHTFVPTKCITHNSIVQIYLAKTAAAMTVVHKPLLSAVEDCVMFVVLIISPLVLKSCFLSSQAVSGSN